MGDSSSSEELQVARSYGSRRNLRGYSISTPYRTQDLHHDFASHSMAKRLRNEATRKVRARGGTKKLRELWVKLPKRGQELLRRSYLGRFIEMAATRTYTRHVDLMFALRERWWDTTHTFHFAWGEMTMTPVDFACITGLPSEGEPLVMDPSFFQQEEEIASLLGAEFEFSSDELRLHTLTEYLTETIRTVRVSNTRALYQLMRTFLLWAVSSTLFANAGTTARLSLLPYLQDLDALDNYDWGGAGLATCYWGMDHLSRDAIGSLTGFTAAWEVWAYELLAVNRFSIKPAPRVPPIMVLWSDDRRVTSGYHRHYSLGELQRLLGEPVNAPIYYPWEGMANITATTRERTTCRYKLVAPVADCLYLGERVSRQWGLGIDAVYVPHDPPVAMLSAGGPGLVPPEPAIHYVYVNADYAEFVSTRLSLPIREPPAEPRLGGSSRGWKTQIRLPRADGSSVKETIEDGEIPEKYRLPPTQHSVDAASFTGLHKSYMGLMERLRRSEFNLASCRCKKATQVVESTSSSSGGSRMASRRSKRSKRRS